MIELQVKYSTDDYVPALRRHLLSQPKFLTLFSFISLLLISVIALMFNSSLHFDVFWFIICSLSLLIGFSGICFYFLPRQRFRRSYKTIDDYRLQITGREIIYDSDYESGALPWRHCTKLHEGRRYYLLEYDRERVMVIPKVAFTDQEEERSFREIVKQRLPPALSKKLWKRRDLEIGSDYVPPKKMPDWR
jgi:hypothetical protein